MIIIITLYACIGILIASHYAGGTAYRIIKRGRAPTAGLMYGIECEPLPRRVIAVVLVAVLVPQISLDTAAWPLTVAWRRLRGTR